MTILKNKIILITGAAGGFGRELTRQLLNEGSLLILSDRDTASVHRAASEIAAGLAQHGVAGRVLSYIAADLASAEGCTGLYSQVQRLTPYVDVLINNAGIACGGAFFDIPQAEWERLMQVNLLAPMRLIAKFLPAMVARRSGHIVNLSSCAGLVGTPGIASYSASKYGLRGFGEAIAQELEPHRIEVTTVYPFFARTPILDSVQFGNGSPRQLPGHLLDDPAMVISELIAGVKANQRHVYPGPTAKRIVHLQRFGPRVVRFVSDRIANQLIAAPGDTPKTTPS